MYRRLGVRTAVVFHGSDARDPERSIELNEHSFFTEADPEWMQRLGEQARRNRRAVASAGLPTFVTTPDMLQHVEGSVLLPITVSPARWAAADAPLHRTVPRVLHRPSANAAVTKGTRHIDRALELLERQGRIERIRTGVVSHDAMPALLHSADIVIDQIQTGAYGVIAIEAMAAGRVVVSSVSEHTRRVLGASSLSSTRTPRPSRLYSTTCSPIEIARGKSLRADRRSSNNGMTATPRRQCWMTGSADPRTRNRSG